MNITKVRHILRLLLMSMLLMLVSVGCDVHEFPDMPDSEKFRIRLKYETDMTIQYYPYADVQRVNTRGVLQYGEMHYTIRAYRVDGKSRNVNDVVREFVFTRDVVLGYDCEFELDLPAGEYKLMVWSQLRENNGDVLFYNNQEFNYITLQGQHKGNTDYRDAFRGVKQISLQPSTQEKDIETHEVIMQRPLAKFEFVTNDLVEFLEKETTRVEMLSRGDAGSVSPDTVSSPMTRIDLADYRVVFRYTGFMPSAYSILTDKPVDSSTGVSFESRLNIISESEASMGFDYVFVNGRESKVTVQVEFYDNEGVLLALTQPVDVPLTRSWHTIVRGSFLMSKVAGGVTINPGYDGDHNIIVP